ncbi:AAA family ATPase [Spirilliplanes yamanashiensis]|uniref:Orc1-like AAA ATPase domain-containing protein n=1 Tax=Spirilliplanes yamanashiensis TaxID=42233 RepID=A0A8J3Y5R2_9ACTN|nr:ATP-binding protein [Spirilliplanes yamanashiensis]MDP9819309.1 hypothetical protein [Spirilliplanes yamanashiensis]GIJ01868.1 hypothetical protein Sya03_12200 [Spirilliplanes yamanashiensis]
MLSTTAIKTFARPGTTTDITAPASPATVLLAAFDGSGGLAEAPATLLLAGGREIPADALGVVAAVFPCARDAARAAVEIARGPGRARIVLATTADAPDPRRRAAVVARLRPLLATVPAGRVIVTEPAAILSGATLPRGVELVDRATTWPICPDAPAQRLYELRVGAPDAADAAGSGGSNVAWARRAVAGRRPENGDAVRALTGMWQQAREGGLRTALLTGPDQDDAHAATAELALRLHADGGLVLYGRWDPATRTPLHAVREAFGVYADGCDPADLRRDLDGRAAEVARLLPELGTRIGVARRAACREPARHPQAYDAIGTWLTRAARRRPVVLVLHDLQWADDASAGLLEHLGHACRRERVLLVLTAAEATGERAPAVDRFLAGAAHTDPGSFRRVLL